MSILQLFFAGGKLNEATGGTITYDGDYQIHTFESNGTFTVTRADVASTPVEVLAVGSGQAGYVGGATNFSPVGGSGGDGGGGGQVVSSSLLLSSFTLNSGYTVTVGPATTINGQAGNSSRLLGTGVDVLAFGGNGTLFAGNYGRGGAATANGTAGTNGTSSAISGTSYVYGSSGGGGGGGNTWPYYVTGSGGAGGTGAGLGGAGGYPGANGNNGSNYGAGGGGGGGAGGTNYASYVAGGNGGNGTQGVVIVRFKYRNL